MDILLVDDDEEDTDPEIFGPVGRQETKTMCLKCGAEIDTSASFARQWRLGATTALNATFSALLRVGVDRESARRIIERLASDVGVDAV